MTNPHTQPLDTVLESLSKDVWERLRDVKNLPAAHSIRFGEETITDLLMLDLNRQRPTRAMFTQTPKHREAVRGTDFEWWLGSDTTGWIRLAVQAKKLDLKSERYLNFKHKVNGVKQINRLERYAARHGAIPLYCLYNYSANAESKVWSCCQRSYDVEELGCTITPSSNIREAMGLWGKKNFDSIHEYEDTVPWRCLALCPRVKGLFRKTHESPPLFGVPPRIYSDLPTRLRRIDERTGALRYDGEYPLDDGFDPELYDQEVGFPRRISVLEISPSASWV